MFIRGNSRAIECARMHTHTPTRTHTVVISFLSFYFPILYYINIRNCNALGGILYCGGASFYFTPNTAISIIIFCPLI